MLKKIIAFFGMTFACVAAFAVITMADTVDINIDSSDGYGCESLLDDDYYTVDYYRTDTVLTVTADEGMDYLYILWDTQPGEWKLTVDGKDSTMGKHGFLHELVKLPAGSKKAQITITTDRTYIADIYGIKGDIPSWVQDWQDPYEEADMLFISAHSDDEALFFGGAIPTYTNDGKTRVQIAYFCDFTITDASYRIHELLNGSWRMGVTHYPQLGEFIDDWPDNEDDIYSIIDYDDVLEYMVRTIRRFKPKVLITHDFDGEYGHPEHKYVAQTVAEALDLTNDASKFSASADKYGTWDVPKAYFHLYQEGQIEIDVHVPLASFDGETCFEVATAAYKEYRSQQWMWFYVSDGTDGGKGAPFSCTKYGLYRSLVGADTGNDMLEHIERYGNQIQETETTETTAGADAQTDVTEQTTAAGDTKPADASETTGAGTDNSTAGKALAVIKVVLIVLGVILGVLVILIVVLLIVSAYKRKKARERRRKRLAAQKKRQRQNR